MYKFMFCTFAFLGWAFWELSGGSDFERPAPADEQIGVLATYDVDSPGTNQRSRLTATTDAPEPIPAALTQTQPVQDDETAPDPASLTSGIAALTEGEAAETFNPTTTAAISVEPVENPVVIEPVANLDIRQVDATRVNMRGGPSTSFDVLDQLDRGENVEILQIPGDGWVKLRVERTGQVGWMAERLLTAPSN